VTSKRKVSLTLDADIVDELGDQGGTALSSQVNDALRLEISRRRRQRALGSLLERLAEEDGPLRDGELEDVGRFEQLLEGR
jgi:antitoxin CcdA